MAGEPYVALAKAVFFRALDDLESDCWEDAARWLIHQDTGMVSMRLCWNIVDSFTDKPLPPLETIAKMAAEIMEERIVQTA
jgi:hypothetical protein